MRGIISLISVGGKRGVFLRQKRARPITGNRHLSSSAFSFPFASPPNSRLLFLQRSGFFTRFRGIAQGFFLIFPSHFDLSFMGSRASHEQVSLVRSVVGDDCSEMDIIRALHMANNDPSAAINIILDTPHVRLVKENGSPVKKSPSGATRKAVPHSEGSAPRQNSCASSPAEPVPRNSCITISEAPSSTSVPGNDQWWLLGSSELAGLSTSKGRRLRAGDPVTFSFPSTTSSNMSTKFSGRGRAVASCSEIVRFFSEEHGEVGVISSIGFP